MIRKRDTSTREQLQLFGKPVIASDIPASTTADGIITPPVEERALTSRDDLPRTDSPLRESRLGSQRSLLEFPFFSLALKPTMDVFTYKDTRGYSLTVKPSHKGAATVYDKDILIYAISILQKKLRLGEPVSRSVTFTRNDLLKSCKRDRSGSSYSAIFDALERLQGTIVTTNVYTEEAGTISTFAWVQSTSTHYVINRSGVKQIEVITITLPEWLYQQIINRRAPLSYHPDYWLLSSPLARRLYEIARSCCIEDKFDIKLANLYEKVGSRSTLRRFKFEVKKIIEENAIPDYMFAMIGDRSDPRTKQLERDGYRVARDLGSILIVIRRRVPKLSDGMVSVLENETIIENQSADDVD